MTHRGPIEEASALFGLFLRSDWASCHVRGGGIELWASRAAHHADPLRPPVTEVQADVEEAGLLLAPHLGTLVSLAEIGSRVARGESYGMIELLGDRIALIADRAGTIARHAAAPGALVQYDEALAALR